MPPAGGQPAYPGYSQPMGGYQQPPPAYYQMPGQGQPPQGQPPQCNINLIN